ncbi:acyltransferase [Microbacterium sp. CFH 31415]|uniref:acyltransferase family protein n=1 Tax=Microbacterium sp. CFH 31415 TaxID=2921732 RepID=UPI001F12ABCC|nr:acyltransferase [Microbacterium sp. CFH 31415]MCH6230735.1 acyltransferase [Microbacterium sp. CFH 31415]
MTETRTAQALPAPAEPTGGIRPEIQALRAVAVILVLLFHLWETRVPSGYIGVDVFFVISGFLITAQLLREIERTGSIRLLDFWARRIRRLLPAAFVVILVTMVALMVVVPRTEWGPSLIESAASALYVENWASLARHLGFLPWVDYPLPVEHFWTLSVEEQFYLLWPLLLLLGVAVAAGRRMSARARVQIIVALIIVAMLLSFAYSLWLSAQHPLHAARSTPSVVWEFAAGGLLALAPRLSQLSLSERAKTAVHCVASWSGLILIVGSALTPELFLHPAPGAVLPVLGAVLVIWGESNRSWLSPTRYGSLAPVQFVGDVSYGIYLWHQPIYVLVLLSTGENVRSVGALAVVAASILLGWLSKRFIEDPFRTSKFWKPLPRTYGFAAGGMLVISAIAGVGILLSAS